LLGQVMAGRMLGVALSDMGQEQARVLAEGIAGLPVRAVFTSPVQRAQETAAPLAARLGLTPQVEPGLDEIDVGAWTGASFDALHAQPGWRAWNRFRGFAPTPGGETMVAVQARALALVGRLCRDWPDAELVLVSHSDVLKAVLMQFLGMPLDLMHRIEVAPASRSVLDVFDEDARVEAINLPVGCLQV
jgi:broad specificity phosphatase PhoE